MEARITKYERANLIGQRAQQLSKMAKPMTSTEGLISCIDIAEKEYREGVIPIKIIRTMPNGKKYVYTIKKKQ